MFPDTLVFLCTWENVWETSWHYELIRKKVETCRASHSRHRPVMWILDRFVPKSTGMILEPLLIWPFSCYLWNKTVSVCCYNGAQRYEQFFHVGWLHRALILLHLALCSCLCVFGLYGAIIKIFLLTSFSLRFNELRLVGLALDVVGLTNHSSSVLWHCWLGHLTRKIVSEMTHNASNGTLNPTIPVPTCYLWTNKLMQQQTVSHWLSLRWGIDRNGDTSTIL